ncbi:MAG: T9SS type A sorting domain-containing protein [Bacteroidetes bacterium]|nr:T9SS type A sorting domain-containing protein [Bacteroidota bacterium]
MRPYTSSRIDSTHVLIGGFMPELYTYNGIVYQNSVAILEYEPPTANFSRNLDSICEFKYAIYFSDYFDLLGKLIWNFPGGTPAFSVKQNPYVQYTTAGTYGASCTLTNPAGTTTYFLPDSITVYPCIIGIDDPIVKATTISIYPNPNNGTFNLSNPYLKSFDISIYDVLGKAIYKTTVQGSSSISIDENNMEPGIYFIACQNPDASQVIKMIKQ